MQKKGSVSIPKTVDEYLKRLAPDQRKALQDVRQVILTTVPDAE
ncbi:MAG: hypothetical protein ACJ75F_10395 [Flavisolibacter sp.]